MCIPTFCIAFVIFVTEENVSHVHMTAEGASVLACRRLAFKSWLIHAVTSTT